MKKINLQVWGRVQGVGFRYMTKMVADQLKLSGTVENKADGSVYIEANGTADDIDRFVEKVIASPSPSGRVEKWQLNEDATQSIHKKFRVTG